MKRVILDVDSGLGLHGADIDDGLEILMALGSEQIVLEAVTVVAGNIDLDHAFSSVKAILTSMEITNIPIGRGHKKPLKKSLVTGYELLSRRIEQGGREYPEGSDLISSVSTCQYEKVRDAVDLLIDAVLSSPGKLTLIATAPLTNIASAIQRDIRFTENLKEIILMGGVYQVEGNVTPHTEFNIATDIDAAKIVFESGIHITMLPLDVTSKTLLSLDRWMSIVDGNEWLSRFAIDATIDWLLFLEEGLGLDGCNLHDPLALAIAIEPDIVTVRPAIVTIETEDPVFAGKSNIQFNIPTSHRPTTYVVVEYDDDRFMEIIESTLRG